MGGLVAQAAERLTFLAEFTALGEPFTES